MKKVILFLTLAFLTACSNDETIKEVEVVKEVPVEVIKEVPVEVIKEVTTLDNIEPYITTLETASNGVSHVGATAFVKKEIKKCFDTTAGQGYDFFNLYIGGNNPNNQKYAYAYIYVVFFKRNVTQEIRVYQPYSGYYRYFDELNYDKFIQVNYPVLETFFNNKFVSSMTKEDFLKL